LNISAAGVVGSAVDAVEARVDAAHRSAGCVGVLTGVLREAQILSIPQS